MKPIHAVYQEGTFHFSETPPKYNGPAGVVVITFHPQTNRRTKSLTTIRSAAHQEKGPNPEPPHFPSAA